MPSSWLYYQSQSATDDDQYVLFVVIKHSTILSTFMTYRQIFNNINKMNPAIEAPYGAPEFSPDF
jgi:hypothetical protein